MSRQVIVNISPAGTVNIDVDGFKGGACAKATEQIEIALGGANAGIKKKKPDFFCAPASTGQTIKRTF